MFLFFAAGLVGLGVGHLLPASQEATRAGTWPKVILIVVSGILLMGFLLSLLQGGTLDVVTGPLVTVLKALATVVFFVVILPIAFLFGLLVQLFFGFLRAISGEPAEPAAEPPVAVVQRLLQQRAAGEESALGMTLLSVIEWTVVALLIAAALAVLALAFHRRARGRGRRDEAQRESLRGDADPAGDLGRLLLGLVPERFKRRRPLRRFRLPDDDPDVVDVFRIYFGLLRLAEERGHPRPPWATPQEYRRTLEEVFPPGLARWATEAFVRACYGHYPAPRREIEEMGRRLEEVARARDGRR